MREEVAITKEGLVRIWDEGKGRYVGNGYIVGRRFYREVDPKEHRMRKHGGGYCIQTIAFKPLEDAGVELVILKVIQNLRNKKKKNKRIQMIKCSLKYWNRCGRVINEKHGDQTILNERHMKVRRLK